MSDDDDKGDSELLHVVDLSHEEPSSRAAITFSLEREVAIAARHRAKTRDLTAFPSLAALLLNIAALTIAASAIVEQAGVWIALITATTVSMVLALVFLERTIRRHKRDISTADRSDLRWIEDHELRAMIRSLATQQALFHNLISENQRTRKRG
ncbi:hypothetical protein [Actinophytocola xanthii]|uniref:hypothetical protein n=1 Tax=Actinophytocola xanthii TaxID=1912961 RepID=UPI0011787359|nr:hypothetical protein [Actinophytocola xanthii]